MRPTLAFPNGSRKRAWVLAFLPLLLALLLELGGALAPHLVERFYSEGIYPSIATALGRIVRVIPFSVAEAAFPPIALLTIFLFCRAFVRLLRCKTGRLNLLLSQVRHAVAIVGSLMLAFQLVWGLNYRRTPVSVALGFDHARPNADELEAIARDVISRINFNYHALHDADPGDFGNKGLNTSSIDQAIQQAYARNSIFPEPTKLSGYSSPKPLFLGGVIAKFGISGIYSPFTAEPNYLSIMPAFDLPVAMGHEMAHARGYAREDEASFVAFVVCANADDTRLRYSAYLSALGVVGELAAIDRERARQVIKLLEEGPRNDLKVRGEFWAKYFGRATYLGTRVNNLYLRANGIRAGVRSYNDVVSLIIAYMRRERMQRAENLRTETSLKAESPSAHPDR
jgi:hypothetical protein